MIKILFLAFSAALILAIVVFRAAWLSDNVFLNQFISHEILSIMAIILTVTIASVANIHLAINRFVSERLTKNPVAAAAADSVKKELRQDCWMIFCAFVSVIFLLIWKGAQPENAVTIAVVHGASLWILIMFLLVLLDVYQVVFAFANIGGAVPSDDEDIAPNEGGGRV